MFYISEPCSVWKYHMIWSYLNQCFMFVSFVRSYQVLKMQTNHNKSYNIRVQPCSFS